MFRTVRTLALLLAVIGAVTLCPTTQSSVQAGGYYYYSPYRGYAYGGPVYYGGYRAYGAGPYIYRAPAPYYTPYGAYGYPTYGYGPPTYYAAPYATGVYTPFGGVTTYSAPYGGVGINLY